MSGKGKIIPADELEFISTKALLGRRKKLLECETSFEESDRYGYEDAPDPDIVGYIEFKNQSQWSVADKKVKEALSHCEYIPSAAERKMSQMQQAKDNY